MRSLRRAEYTPLAQYTPSTWNDMQKSGEGPRRISMVHTATSETRKVASLVHAVISLSALMILMTRDGLMVYVKELSATLSSSSSWLTSSMMVTGAALAARDLLTRLAGCGAAEG